MILVTGGTGRLGTLVVERLAARGVDVRVLTRATERANHLSRTVSVEVGDVRDRAAVVHAVDGCDLVVSAAHGFIGPRGNSPATVDRDGNANVVDAARAAGADLVLLSVVGADPGSPMELFRMKHAAEQHAIASGVPITIVRSTAFAELWIDLLRETASRSGRPLVFGLGDNPVNFVSVADVAALVDRVIDDPSTRGLCLEIGGPENLTFGQLARAVQAADERTGAPRHIPRAALRFLASTVGRVRPQSHRQMLAALAMDTADLRFDACPIHQRYPDLNCTAVAQILAAPA